MKNMDTNKLIYYVYAYLRYKTTKNGKKGSPYYIGKGHYTRAFDSHKHIPVPKDKSLIVFLETNLTELGAFAIERRMIKWYGRKNLKTGILGNRTDGGDGASGRIPANKGMPSPNKGKPNGRKGVSNGRKGISNKTMKGKTYEELYGTERAIELKNMRIDTCWINNRTENKKIKSTELQQCVSNGWIPGRIIIEIPTTPLPEDLCYFVSPEGLIYETNNLKRFSESMELNGSAMSKLKRKLIRQHVGWTIAEDLTNEQVIRCYYSKQRFLNKYTVQRKIT